MFRLENKTYDRNELEKSKVIEEVKSNRRNSQQDELQNLIEKEEAALKKAGLDDLSDLQAMIDNRR